MTAALIVLHVSVCIILIAVVLLQRGKGAEMGAVFGGGASSTVFGSRGAGTFLSKLTTGCAVVFMLTSLSLSYIYTESADEQLFEGGVAEKPDSLGESPFEQLGTVDAETTPGTEAATAIDPLGESNAQSAQETEPDGS